MTSRLLNLTTFDTEWNADCVEWCPIEMNQDVLVCGTYQLVESSSQSNQRHGCLHLLRFAEDESCKKLVYLQKFATEAAVLDVKWKENLFNNYPTLVAANAKGKIEMYRLKDKKLELSKTYDIGNDALLLSLDWYTDPSFHSDNSSIAISDSTGSITVLNAHSDGELVQLKQWKAHDYEAWVVAFNRWQPTVVYSGGDDCFLKGWDIRESKSILKNQSHSMGVTSIASNPFKEYILATGSYDENVLLWDTRWFKSPLSEYKSGGGVWRLKWAPQDGRHLLAACMHHGIVLVDYNKSDEPHLLAHYTNHKSMAYGIDWHRKPNSRMPFNTNIASCSFYDHTLQIWTVASF